MNEARYSMYHGATFFNVKPPFMKLYKKTETDDDLVLQIIVFDSDEHMSKYIKEVADKSDVIKNYVAYFTESLEKIII